MNINYNKLYINNDKFMHKPNMIQNIGLQITLSIHFYFANSNLFLQIFTQNPNLYVKLHKKYIKIIWKVIKKQKTIDECIRWW